MTLIVRQAEPHDAADMCDVINPLIIAGGTTAYQTLFTPEKALRTKIAPDNLVSCAVAIDGDRMLGWQSLVWATWEHDSMPPGWAIIASFVRTDAAGQGVGKKLFQFTHAKAVAADVMVIDATIRADNDNGLRYYSGIGFVDYAQIPNAPLSDGTLVTRIRKRFNIG